VDSYIVDLFRGPGGWSTGLRSLGFTGVEVGLDIDKSACATAIATGHTETASVDIYEQDPAVFGRGMVDGLIASPPCPTFSAAGGRFGRLLVEIILRCLRDAAAGRDTRAECREEAYRLLKPIMWDKEFAASQRQGRPPIEGRAKGRAWRDACMSILVVEPMRWTVALEPKWIALEQVPDVLGVWKVMAELLRDQGYNVWTGVLEAERYGVPQTRERAILMADRERPVAPPPPTHQRFVPGEPAREEHTLEGVIAPWVSMRQALGVAAEYERRQSKDGRTGEPNRRRDPDEPAPTIAGESRNDSWVLGFPRAGDENGPQTDDGYRERDFRSIDEPAFAITEKARSAVLRQNGRGNATVRDVDEPAPTITGGHDFNERRWEVHDTGNTRGAGEPTTTGRVRDADQPAPPLTSRADQLEKRLSEPATTIQGDSRVWPRGHKQNSKDPPGKYEGRAGKNAIRVEPHEAAALQSFPPGYPFQGSRMAVFRQIGDAMPPVLAKAVLAELVRL
jgi:DNA (cytosine-5)-methyltransferase 1